MARDTRSPPRWLVVAATILVLATVLTALRERHDARAEADLVHWKSVDDAARALSANPGLPVLYDFTAAWCHPCAALRADVFGDEQGAALVSQFLAVRITDVDVQREAAAQALEARFLVDSLPTLVITSPRFEKPLVLRGYPGRAATIAFLAEAARQLEAQRDAR